MSILWHFEFRHFAAYDYATPLMYIPVQRAGLMGETQEEAMRELLTWAGPGGRIDVISCECAPDWLQPKE